jgi:hypothetical protein
LSGRDIFVSPELQLKINGMLNELLRRSQSAASANKLLQIFEKPTSSRIQRKRTYPTKGEVSRAVEATRASGMRVETLEVRRDGTIRVGPADAPSPAENSEFDRWDAAGKL